MQTIKWKIIAVIVVPMFTKLNIHQAVTKVWVDQV